jgi:hypothetical protein
MTVSAQQAVNEVLIGYLRNASALWGVRAYPVEIAPSGVQRPYVVFFPASNMAPASNPHHKKAELAMSIKGVTLDMANALGIQEVLTTLLDDSGDQDINPRLPTHAGWRITTVSIDRAIWLQELDTVGTMIYHAGHQYQVRMERR